MLPHTHFLIGLMLGLLAWQSGLLSWKLALVVGIVAALIDLDHVYAYHKHHGDWDVEGAWRRAISYHECERTIIHQAYGFVGITMLLIILGIFSPAYMAVGGLAYYSHYFLDHAHLSYERRLREGKITIPLSHLEITLDAICVAVVLILVLL